MFWPKTKEGMTEWWKWYKEVPALYWSPNTVLSGWSNQTASNQISDNSNPLHNDGICTSQTSSRAL